MAEPIDKDEFGWSKIKRERQGGKTRFGKDYYVVSPLGKRSRSFRDLAIHIKENNLYDKINPRIINLEKFDENVPSTSVERIPKSNNGKEFLMFLETKGEYEPKFMIRKPKKPKEPSVAPTSENQGGQKRKTSDNNNRVVVNKQKKIDPKNCEECDECKSLTPKKEIIVEDDGKILCPMCWASAHPDPAGVTLKLNANRIGMKKCDQCYDFTENDQLTPKNDQVFRGRVEMLCQDCICPDPKTVLDSWYANRRILPLLHEAETLARKTRLPVDEIRKYIEDLMMDLTAGSQALNYPTDPDAGDELAPVVVKQEPVEATEEDNSEPLERVSSIHAEFGGSTIFDPNFDPLADVKDEVLDPKEDSILNKKSFEYPKKPAMDRPGPAPKKNEPIKLYHEVYIKTEPDDEENIVYDVPSNSDEDEIPDFDGDFSDDDDLTENENVEIGNGNDVASIKEEPLDQLANWNLFNKCHNYPDDVTTSCDFTKIPRKDKIKREITYNAITQNPRRDELLDNPEDVNKKRKTRCGECEGCKSQNCDNCVYCKDSKRMGGPNRMKQACKERICRNKNYSNKSLTQQQKKLTVKTKNLNENSQDLSKNPAPILPSSTEQPMDQPGGLALPVCHIKTEPDEDYMHEIISNSGHEYESCDELLDNPEDINKNSFEHPEKPMDLSPVCHIKIEPGPDEDYMHAIISNKSGNNELVYIKNEPDDEDIVYDISSNSDEDEIPDFDGDFSDDYDDLTEENVEIGNGNVALIKAEPSDQLAD